MHLIYFRKILNLCCSYQRFLDCMYCDDIFYNPSLLIVPLFDHLFILHLQVAQTFHFSVVICCTCQEKFLSINLWILLFNYRNYKICVQNTHCILGKTYTAICNLWAILHFGALQLKFSSCKGNHQYFLGMYSKTFIICWFHNYYIPQH